MSVAYSAKPGPAWVDLKIEATARYFFQKHLDSILEQESGKIHFDLLSLLESSNWQLGSRGLQTMTREADLEAIRAYTRETSDASALRELAMDLLEALAMAQQGNMGSADEIIESWADTAEIKSDPEAVARIERGLKQAESGTGRVWRPRTKSN